MIRNKELELYIHIPFCVKKCAYCDFLSGPATEECIEQYVSSLVKEMEAHKESVCGYEVVSIFLGGGTPSVLNEEQVKRLFETIRKNFVLREDAEITMEANPGTVTKEKLLAYKEAGINRLSFGLQSTNDEELKELGRIHTYETFLKNYKLARECGFRNINVDLISAIPKQTVESWKVSLEQVIALEPEHISTYSLIVEEGTPFAALYGEGGPREKELPDEMVEREIYYQTEEILSRAGYQRYEISNYAKPGKECKHNLGYWERREYLGIGIGAASLMGNIRYKNVDNIEFYVEHSHDLQEIQEEKEELSVKAQMEEFFFLGLRKMEGVSAKEFKETFDCDVQEHYGTEIKKLTNEGLLKENDGRLMLTKKGIDISNYVFAEFLD